MEPFGVELVDMNMTISSNPKLIHSLHGNRLLARGLTIRFIENAPILMEVFKNAMMNGDASTAHCAAQRLESHCRVMGLDHAIDALQSLDVRARDIDSFEESEAWNVLQESVRSVSI